MIDWLKYGSGRWKTQAHTYFYKITHIISNITEKGPWLDLISHSTLILSLTVPRNR